MTKIITINNIQYFKIPSFIYYYISKEGKIYSISKNDIKDTKIDKQGYEKVGLCTERGLKTIRCRVHEMMAITFLDEKYKEKGLYVNHIDANKSNNILTNLEIITPSNNNIHAVHHKLSSSYKFIDIIGINDNSSIFIKRLRILNELNIRVNRKKVALAIQNGTMYKGYSWYMYHDFLKLQSVT